MTDLKEKERIAIKMLKMFEPESEPYYLCYSGGKDSDCIRILAQLGGVKHDIVHNLTTADVPETIRYIKTIPNVKIDKARYNDGTPITMWNLIIKKGMPPTRLRRYCCNYLKESGGKGRLKIIGVRAAESKTRAINGGDIKIIGKPKTTERYLCDNEIDYDVTKQGGLILNYDNHGARRAVEHCYRTTSTMISPILNWSDSDVWNFLHYYGCESNPLYKCGDNRIGCIGCPMSGYNGMKNDFIKYPKYKQLYMNTFDKMLIEREKRGMKKLEKLGNTGIDVFNWWVGGEPK